MPPYACVVCPKRAWFRGVLSELVSLLLIFLSFYWYYHCSQIPARDYGGSGDEFGMNYFLKKIETEQDLPKLLEDKDESGSESSEDEYPRFFLFARSTPWSQPLPHLRTRSFLPRLHQTKLLRLLISSLLRLWVREKFMHKDRFHLRAKFLVVHCRLVMVIRSKDRTIFCIALTFRKTWTSSSSSSLEIRVQIQIEVQKKKKFKCKFKSKINPSSSSRFFENPKFKVKFTKFKFKFKFNLNFHIQNV